MGQRDRTRAKENLTRYRRTFGVLFGTTADVWLNLQAQYDAKIAERDLVPRFAKLIRRSTAV
jgi:plasmid maintenance system antidote protein VapI